MTTANRKKTIGVILCGSGFKDGSEIRESVATLWALSQHDVVVKCYAPNVPQTEVVNCLTGEQVKNETRNMLVESARIARGQVQPLDQFSEGEIDALIIPGGYGAAKNLCNFAYKGAEGEVRSDLLQILENMHTHKKPIGAICIAPAIVGLALKNKNIKLTLGAQGEASQEIEKLGHRHQVCAADECVIDEAHRILSTPAYMHDQAPLHQIFEGIRKLVAELVTMVSVSKS